MDDLDVLHEDLPVSVSMNSNNSEARCPFGSVMYGIQNPGGTKNMHDIQKLDCRSYRVVGAGGPMSLETVGTEIKVPLKFSGTGETSSTSCPSGYWATGLARGSNNNPNSASIICQRLALGGNNYLIPGTPASFDSRLDDTASHGRCDAGRAVTGLQLQDKGTNIYDIKKLNCQHGAGFEGSFPEVYDEFMRRTPEERKALCCKTNLGYDQKLACYLANYRDANMKDGCISLGDEWCRTAPAGDEACSQWCDAYPTECKTTVFPPGEEDRNDRLPPLDSHVPEEDSSSWKIFLFVIIGIVVVVAVGQVIRKGLGDKVEPAAEAGIEIMDIFAME